MEIKEKGGHIRAVQRTAQAAVELIVILGIGLVVLLGIVSLSHETSNRVGGAFQSAKASTLVDDLADAATLVYQQGDGSKTTVFVTIPSDVSSILIEGTTITMTLTVAGEERVVYRSTDFNVSGSVPLTPGNHWITVEAQSAQVVIGNVIPPTVIDTAPSGFITVNSTTLSATTDKQATCKYSTSDENYSTMPSLFDGEAMTHTAPIGPLSEGAYTYYVRCVDTSGNVMNSSALIQFTVDLTPDVVAPVINNFYAVPDPVAPGQTIVITANVTDNNNAVDTVLVQVNGTNNTMSKAGDLYSYAGFDTNSTTGIFTYTVYANDTNNNYATPKGGNFTVQWVPQKALLTYFDASTPNYPRSRLWNGSSISGEQSALSVGSANSGWHVLKAARTRQEQILVTKDTDNNINVQIWNGSLWHNLSELSTESGSTTYKSLDLAYEQESDRAMVVFRDNTDGSVPHYILWNGTSYSSEGTAIDVGSDIQWIRLASKPASNELVLVTLDSDDDINAQFWDGAGWGDLTEIETEAETANFQSFDVIYEQVSGHALLVWMPLDESQPHYRVWNGSPWTPETLANDVGSSDVRWVSLAAKPSSNEVVLATLDDGDDLNVQVWSGNAFGVVSELATSVESSEQRSFALAYQQNSTNLMLVYGDNNDDVPVYYTYNGSWFGPFDALSVGAYPRWLTMDANPHADEIGLLILDDDNDVSIQRWNGSAWRDYAELEASSEDQYGMPFALTYTRFDEEFSVDQTPPVLLNLTAHSLTSSSVIISWETDEAANATLAYGTSLSLDTVVTNSSLGSNHSFALTGLLENTLYYYQATSCDASGNCHTSSIYNVTTSNGTTVPLYRAMVTYFDTTNATTPRYRLWNSSLSNEQSASSITGTQVWHVLRSSPTVNENILGVLGTTNVISAQVWNGTGWSSAQQLSSNAGGASTRPFDIGYEQSTGRALAVYRKTSQPTVPGYRIWNGSWSSEASTGAVGTGALRWVRLIEKPSSPELILMTLDSASDLYAQVWNGSSWSMVTLLESTVESPSYQSFDGAYEQQSGHAVLVWAERDSNTPEYVIWNGSSFSSEAAAKSAGSTDLYWLKLAADPQSDTMLLGILDGGRDLNVQVWNGSGFSTNIELDDYTETFSQRAFDIVYEQNTSRALLVYGDRDDDVPVYYTYNGTLAGPYDALDVGGDPAWVHLASNPSINEVLVVILENQNNDVSFQRWNTTTWSDYTEIESSSSLSGEHMGLSYDRSS